MPNSKALIITVLLTLCVFGLGLWLGNRYSQATVGSKLLRDHFVDTTDSYFLLDHLEKGQIEDAKQVLRYRIDTGILAIDSLQDYLIDSDSKSAACSIMASYSRWRRKNESFVYPSAVTNGSKIRKRVTEVLDNPKPCK